MARPNRQAPEKRCRSCAEVKPQAAFPEGRTPKRRGYLCWPCLEERAWAMHDRDYVPMSQKRTTREVDGVLVRRCCRCGDEKPLLDDFYRQRRSVTVMSEYSYECKTCSHASASETTKAKMETRAGDALRARRAKRARQARATTEGKAKHLAAQKRYAEKRKADPERHAAHLESVRLAYRLRREREGRPVTRRYRNVARIRSTAPKTITVEPLLAFIDRLIEQRSAVATVIGDVYKTDGIVAEVCSDLGIKDRTLRRWRAERSASIGLVEKVLLEAGVEWHDVYSYDDHRAAFLAEPVGAGRGA